MTASYHRGELAAVLGEVEALHAALIARGFAIVRTKLEALASNDGVPLADGDAGGYFEFHVKVRVASEAALPELAAIAAAHGARRRATIAAATATAARSSRCARITWVRAWRPRARRFVAARRVSSRASRASTLYDSRIELDAGPAGATRPVSEANIRIAERPRGSAGRLRRARDITSWPA
jgi:hypothetical protein